MKRLFEIYHRMIIITETMALLTKIGLNNDDAEEVLMISLKMEKLMKEAAELYLESQKLAKELEWASRN